MSAHREPLRSRLELVQVGLGDNVSAAVSRIDGKLRSRGLVISHLPLAEFLAEESYEVPEGTPLVRLDLTGDEIYFAQVLAGPHWLETLAPGNIRPPLREPQRYAGETWSDMPRWYVAPDVYAALAPAAGVVIEHLAGNTPAVS